MDDLASKISQILDNPESMEQIKSMADSLFSGSNEKSAENVQNPPGSQSSAPPNLSGLGALGDLGGLSGIADSIDIGALMKVAKILKNQVDDDRARLLLALRPHLSDERQKRVDKAVKILKLVSLVPIFKEQGILNF